MGQVSILGPIRLKGLALQAQPLGPLAFVSGLFSEKGNHCEPVSHPKGIYCKQIVVSVKVLALKSGSLKCINKGIKREEFKESSKVC